MYGIPPHGFSRLITSEFILGININKTIILCSCSGTSFSLLLSSYTGTMVWYGITKIRQTQILSLEEVSVSESTSSEHCWSLSLSCSLTETVRLLLSSLSRRCGTNDGHCTRCAVGHCCQRVQAPVTLCCCCQQSSTAAACYTALEQQHREYRRW